jgi:Predicted membrane protein
MAISHSGRLAPRRLGGGDSGISGSRTGPGTQAYWIVAAAVLIVHQGWDWNRSVQRGLERIIGTLLGLALAGAVLWVAPQGLWLALMLAALQFLICMLVVGNYALAVIFITALAIHDGIRRTRGGKHRRAPLGSRHRYNNRLHDRNRRAAGDGASRVGRSDPARTRRGSRCRSRAAEIRRRRRCGFPRG